MAPTSDTMLRNDALYELKLSGRSKFVIRVSRKSFCNKNFEKSAIGEGFRTLRGRLGGGTNVDGTGNDTVFTCGTWFGETYTGGC